jgi:hypothetical protein
MTVALPLGFAETLAALLLAHVLADFVFQTAWMVRHKRNVFVLLLHIAFVFVLTTATTGGVWEVAVPLALAHLIIDIFKTYAPRHLRETLAAFLLDQAAHLATLVAAAWLWPRTLQAGELAPWANDLLLPMVLLSGFVLTVLAGGHVVGLLTRKYTGQIEQDGLPDAGRVIGQLERTLIFLLIWLDQPAGIGFLIAAKSILRYDTTAQQKAGEYVIIGTLASFTWALAVGYGTLGLLEILSARP